ncbi:hypothetical protein DU475_09385 [Rhodopseudomonas sp. WA056]|uniref:hypothetical protein n=1 Tax=Rhodopseudomonas sp. WA056 TaxID=2269367 RepID=UPI0013DE8816|nr:hypothetical protein [Rhodopseudomonas sp. WA056]NEW87473.1 hypothetical protein [Rhodopseudomonas sp. WA056]
MIEHDFDSRTLANMEVALDRICGTLRDGQDHAVRARVAEAILASARNGRQSLGELEAAGRRASRGLADQADGG